jgi:hypothetical protein
MEYEIEGSKRDTVELGYGKRMPVASMSVLHRHGTGLWAG